ncbi:MAG: TRAM domain-containing protein [Elusimicrobiaceae bacterium]|nr:TRAM domain-containing protein [Elusimicrobiaceae bacterium]
MLFWLFRIALIVGLPLLTYVFLHNWYSVTLAFILALILVAAEYFLRTLKFIAIMIGVVGAVLGYGLFYVCNQYIITEMALPEVTAFWQSNSATIAAVLTMLGACIALMRAPVIAGITRKGRHIKVVDSSALMDGRIYDLCEGGFMTGELLISKTATSVLYTLAASKDLKEKARGKRGLDVLRRLKEIKGLNVAKTSKEGKGRNEQQKLVSIASDYKASIVTVDFNVNKEAIIKNVPVLNIADLTRALKPVFLPGTKITVFVMKEGKEKDQGVAYLDDGSMVVIEGGHKFIGKRAEAEVYSILQTSAGKMFFTRICEPEER